MKDKAVELDIKLGKRVEFDFCASITGEGVSHEIKCSEVLLVNADATADGIRDKINERITEKVKDFLTANEVQGDLKLDVEVFPYKVATVNTKIAATFK